ncbi:MAG: OmpH family outer membrane protein [Rikenellaceae bacterium]
MKRLFIFASVAALSLSACNNAATTQTADSTEVASVTSSDIAYVRTDMILAQSDIFKTEGEALRAKGEKSQASWAKSEQGFQYEASQLQQKYQKGLITTANAQSQQAAIEKRVQNYQAKVQKEAQALEEENYVFTNRTQDLFRRAVAQLNADKKYKMIIDAAAIVDADTTLDISTQVLDILNQLYAAEPKEAPVSQE